MDEQMKQEAKKLLKVGNIALIFLVIFLAASALNVLKDWRSNNPVYNSISINGQGEAVAVPDIAAFSFTVSADAMNVSDAQATVTKKMDAILADLKAMGIEDKDIQTSDYSVWPKYTYVQVACMGGACPPSRQIPDGYTVNHSVSVKIRKTADAGKVLASVGAKGATNVSGLSFTTDDPNIIVAEARAKAVEDAKSKAEALAKKLGVKIVRVVGYYDNHGGPSPMYAEGLGGAGAMNAKVFDAAPTLPQGQNKVTVNVTVNYEIR